MATKLLDFLHSWDAGEWGPVTLQSNGISVLRSTNFTNTGKIDFENEVYLDIDKDKLQLKKLEIGDILLERSGGGPKQPVGRVVIFNKQNGNYICGNFISRLVPNRKLVDPEYLLNKLLLFHWTEGTLKYQSATIGIRNLDLKGYLQQDFHVPELPKQRIDVKKIKERLKEIDKAQKTAEEQLKELDNLANSIIFASLKRGKCSTHKLGKILFEVKEGIGEEWERYEVLGATKKGIAPAKEPPGKYPHKYKPVTPDTVFYNPMRILIGSIAYLDENEKTGITSPDYVVVKGAENILDTRWFYYWLRSPLGQEYILSLARGAVRERMLYNRLKIGSIQIPDINLQKKASETLKKIKTMRQSIEEKLNELEKLPQKILAQIFGN